MRGGDLRSEALFSYLSCAARVPLDHPLRPIQKIVDEALGALTGEFEKLYAKLGRPSIPPEKLLRDLLLQAFYSVRSERQLMEQLGYNLLFRWFVGLSNGDQAPRGNNVKDLHVKFVPANPRGNEFQTSPRSSLEIIQRVAVLVVLPNPNSARLTVIRDLYHSRRV
jgi:hypothetical protein